MFTKFKLIQCKRNCPELGQTSPTGLQYRKRLSEQTKVAVACNSVTQTKLRVFPLFAKEVFMEVLQELGIEVHQSSFEADEVIAHLAHTSRCPVISNDSDFYIFDVDFILLDSLDIANFSSEDTFLRCEKFNRQKMLSHYGLGSIELLHLLAALTGNDYIPPEVFDKVFLNIKLVTKRRDMTERHRKIRSLLVYLSKERSVAAALAKLLSFMPEAERAKARAKVLESVRLYDASVAASVVSPDFSTFNGASLPTWFEAWVFVHILLEINHSFIDLSSGTYCKHSDYHQ